MRRGYLLIETHPAFPDRVRLVTSNQLPSAIAHPTPLAPSDAPQVRYAAAFSDLEVASMHAHEALRHHLVDIDAHLYRVDPREAVAAVESIALRHRRVYLDPVLAADPGLGGEIKRRQQRLRRLDRFWSWAGIAAVLLLLLKLLLGI